jgi:GGDEF domain-containing protein
MLKPTVLQIYFNEEKKSFIQTALQENDLNVIPLIPKKDIFPFVTEQNFPQYLIEQKIDLILIDPAEDHLLECLTLIEYLKENTWLASVPILIFGGKDSTFRCEAYKKGAIGVVTDSFGSEELIYLIKAIFYQMEVLKPKNSVSGLPSGTLVEQEISRRLDRQEPLYVACIMANQLAWFRDKYGLDTMDEVIRELALIIKVAVHDLGSEDDFIGQIDYNHFIMVTKSERIERICQEIIKVFERDFKLLHYDEEDQKNGFMNYQGRRGEAREVPFISLAIGISSNEKKPIISSSQAIYLAQEVQKRAINSNKSGYYKDQRIFLLSAPTPNQS